MGIRIKRAYLPPEPSDGYRVLVDRIWPRGLSRSRLRLHAGLPEVAPSADLRKWFSHDPARWAEFKKRYFAELRSTQAAVNQLAILAQSETLTLLFSSREAKYNNSRPLVPPLHEMFAWSLL